MDGVKERENKIKNAVLFAFTLIAAYAVHYGLVYYLGNLPRTEHRYDYSSSVSSDSPSTSSGSEISLENALADMNGSTPSYLVNTLGERCHITESEFEFSDVYRGNIVRTEILSDTPDESGRIPVKVILSKGSAAAKSSKADFKNLIDPDKWFDGTKREEIGGGGFTVSYNEYMTAGGLKCRVRFFSTDFYVDKNGSVVYTGEQYIAMQAGYLGEVNIIPCGYESSVNGKPLSYKYTDHFSLKLEDYNGDGTPDFCYRVGYPDGRGGSYYSILLTNADGIPELRPYGERNDFYVFGETAESIRLDIIDRDTYLFMTHSKGGSDAVPSVIDMRTGSGKSIYDYVNNGLIFSSRYENGRIRLKATNFHMAESSLNAELTLKRYDEMYWEEIPLADNKAVFQAQDILVGGIRIPIDLEKGLYKIEVTIKGTTTVTEFYVR